GDGGVQPGLPAAGGALVPAGRGAGGRAVLRGAAERAGAGAAAGRHERQARPAQAAGGAEGRRGAQRTGGPDPEAAHPRVLRGHPKGDGRRSPMQRGIAAGVAACGYRGWMTTGILVPGAGYTTQGPVFDIADAVLSALGAGVVAIEWRVPGGLPDA